MHTQLLELATRPGNCDVKNGVEEAAATATPSFRAQRIGGTSVITVELVTIRNCGKEVLTQHRLKVLYFGLPLRWWQ